MLKRLSGGQRLILIAGIAASLVALYPPWVKSWDASPIASQDDLWGLYGSPVAGSEPLGHYFLFHPPRGGGSHDHIRVDFGRVFLYWAAIGGAATGLVIITGRASAN